MGLVYQVRCEVNGKCYVGRTKYTLEWRREVHEKEAADGSNFLFHRALRRHGFSSFIWTVLEDDEDEEYIFWAEIQLIRKLKTKIPNGYNMTDGGEGTIGLKWSMESRKRRSQEKLALFEDPENRRKASEIMRSVWQDPSFREQMLVIMQSTMRSKEALLKRAATMRQYYDDPTYLAKMSEIAKAACTDEVVSKLRTAAQMQWSDPKARAAMSRIKRTQYNSPEGDAIKEKLRQANLGKSQTEGSKRKKSEAMKKYNTEEHRKKLSETTKAGWARRKARLKQEEEDNTNNKALGDEEAAD